MMRVSIFRPGRKRLALAAGAAAIAALTIVGGAAAANAATAPAPRAGTHTTGEAPTVVGVNCAPDLGGVRPAAAKPVPGRPVAGDANGPAVIAVDCDPDLTPADGDGPGLVEVPGAVPDFDQVQPGTAKELGAVPQPVDGGGRTTAKR